MTSMDLNTCIQELRKLGIRTKVIDEFERICQQYPDAAATLGFEMVSAAISGAQINPNLSQTGRSMLESLLVAHLQQVVLHATGKMPSDLHHILD